MIHTERILRANEILATFSGHDIELAADRGRIFVSWKTHRGTRLRRCWLTRGQDFYPVWDRVAGWGGTQSMAISQLIRWIKGKPVLPFASWEWWASEKVDLCNGRTLELLRAANWPAMAICVLCHQVAQGLDWWNLDGVSGPCCSGNRGCRQKAGAA